MMPETIPMLRGVFFSALAAAISQIMVIALPYSAEAQPFEMRTWKTAEGSYSVKARLIETVAGESIVLEKENGERVTVKLEILSQTDRQYVQEQASAGTSGKKKTATGPMDYSQVRILKADREIPWQAIPPAALPRVELGELTTFPIEDDVSPSFTSLLADPTGSRLLLVSGSLTDGFGRVFDLVNRQAVGGRIQFPGGCTPLALSADSKSLIVTPPRRFDANAVWLAAGNSGIRERLAWQYSTNRIAKLTLARFLEAGRLLTADTLGVISMWDLEGRTLLWQIETVRGCIPAVSHDSKTLVSCNDNYLFQIDLQSQEVVGCLPMNIGGPICFGFNPQGSEVIAISWGALRRIEATSGVVREHWNVPTNIGVNIEGWVNDHQFLLKNLTSGTYNVIDLELRGDVRMYQVRTIGGATTTDGQSRTWSLLRQVDGGTIRYSMEGHRLPHEEVQEWCQRQNPIDFVLLKPGDAIQLKINAMVHDATPEQLDRMDEIVKSLRDRDEDLEPPRARRPGAAGQRQKSVSDEDPNRLAKALQAVKLDPYDATQQAREILLEKIRERGWRVDGNARLTLHAEIAHPDRVTDVVKPRSGVPTPEILPLPYSLKFHVYITDENGELVWKSRSQEYGFRPGDLANVGKRHATTTPDGVQYLGEVDFPSTIVKFRPPGYSVIEAGQIVDHDFKN